MVELDLITFIIIFGMQEEDISPGVESYRIHDGNYVWIQKTVGCVILIGLFIPQPVSLTYYPLHGFLSNFSNKLVKYKVLNLSVPSMYYTFSLCLFRHVFPLISEFYFSYTLLIKSEITFVKQFCVAYKKKVKYDKHKQCAL